MDDSSKRPDSVPQNLTQPDRQSTGTSSAGRSSGLRTNPWVVCLLPFAVFMLAGTLEPTPPPALSPAAAAPSTPAELRWKEIHEAVRETNFLGIHIYYADYPRIYVLKILLTLAAIGFVWPGYRQMVPELGWWRISLLAIVVGAVGIVVWIALAFCCSWVMLKMGWSMSLGTRSAFNPLERFAGRPGLAYGFLAVRFFGLVMLVPVLEEFFLRGFVMRFVVEANWWRVSLGQMTRLAVVLGTAVPVFLHPGEALAAAVWFSAVTWLMLRTRNIWDCIVAHAVTNLLLGIWVVGSGQWWLM